MPSEAISTVILLVEGKTSIGRDTESFACLITF